MNRVLAGVYDPGASLSHEHTLRALHAALDEEGSVEVAELGALTLAWTTVEHGAGLRCGAWLCLMDGHVYNLDAVAEEAGVPPGPPEDVIGRAYERLGERLLTILRGDFALVLWHRESGRGVLACDHLGGRGVVFHEAGGPLVFASEVRNLIRMLPRRPEPDRAALAHWIGISGPPADRTLFAGVRRVRPGHLIEFGRAGLNGRSYWRPRHVETLRISRDEAVEEVRVAVGRAIDRRALPGERVAVMLSGGVDSTSVCALAKRTLPEERAPVAAYSAVFPKHPLVDESHLIDRLTDHIGVPSVRIAVDDGSVLAGALEFIRAWQLPPTSPNLFFWLPLLRRAADDGISAMLDGEGGDEMFGFSGYLLADMIRRGRIAKAVQLARRFPTGTGGVDVERVLGRLRDFGVRPALPGWVRQARRRFRHPERQQPGWFREETARAYAQTDEQWSWLETPGPRWAAWWAHTLTWSAGPVAAYDHIRQRARLGGVEARHPLNDVDLIELMLSLPPELAFETRFDRPLFRQAMEGILPDQVRLRPVKSFFDEVFHGILRGHDLPVAKRLLAPGSAELGAYVDLELLGRQLLDPPPPTELEPRTYWAVQLWRLLTAECWLRAQADSAFPDAMLGGGELRSARYALLDTSSSAL